MRAERSTDGCTGPDGPGATIAVVGAGAAGTLATIELLRVAAGLRHPLNVVLIDRIGHGPGLAYGTHDDQHRLNVPTAAMSARCDDPGHFLRWSRARGTPAEPYEFAPRRRYGRYLEDLLVEARWRAGDDVRVALCTSEAVALRGHTVALADGGEVAADAVVLALGNPPPAVPAGLEPHPRLVADPWARNGLDRVESPRRILLLGTGLTMVDVALSLARDFPEAELVAASRSGLLPRAHAAQPEDPCAPVIDPYVPLTLDVVVATVGRAVAERPAAWRSVVDGLRPVTQAVWQALSLADRRRFLAEGHARRWEVVRHRMAPAIAERLDALREECRLTTCAAAVTRAAPARHGLVVELDGRARAFSHVVNCTGPDLDVRSSPDALVRDLLRTRRARPHPLALGFDVDHEGALIGADGRPDPRTLVVGTLRRGALYETTAIPELRAQAARAAELLVEERVRAVAQA